MSARSAETVSAEDLHHAAPVLGRPVTSLDTRRLLAFSTLSIPIYAVQMPLNVYLPAIYGQSFGVPLTVLGVLFFVAKIWGTVTDPIIGTLGDATRHRFGRRRVWLLAGGFVFGLAGLFIFFPMMDITAAYIGITLFIFYLGWSMLQIPYLAWSGEIAGEYHERTRVVTYQTVTGSIALILVLLLPTMVDQWHPDDGRLKLAAIGIAILVPLIPALALTLRAFPDSPLPKAIGEGQRLSLAGAFRVILGDRLLMRVLASDFALSFGQAVRGALIVFFVSSYMGLPHWASGLFLLQFVFGIAAGPIWMKIAYRLGKHRTAVAGELVQVAVNLGLLLVGRGDFGLLLALTIAQGLSQGSGNLMLRSMAADVADKHLLDTGHDRTSLFFSVFSVSAKAGIAIAMVVALPLVAWFGFDPMAAKNPSEALRGLLWVFALGPAAGHFISALLVYRFPLDEDAHREIRRRLEQRSAAREAQ